VPPYNTDIAFTAAVNGVFYNTKSPHNLASFVFWQGKRLGEFPVTETKVRSALVCYSDGKVEVGYMEVKSGKYLFNGAPLDLTKVKYAFTGGGLFLWGDKTFTARQVARKENLSLYITTHPRYSAILVHKDKKTISLIVVSGTPPSSLAKTLKGKYYALLRLDGGSATIAFKGKMPKWVNNAVGFVQ